ncbi:asparaginase domain-containing protein [Buchnera aphidicola]|uniref:asparaginase domain-containing protein n=1 Tax=Buchnera aphidicola TaxID=9 RepID=UPI0039671DE1
MYTNDRQNLLYSLLIAINHPINEITLFFHYRLYRENRKTISHVDNFDAFSFPNFKL